MPPSRRITTFEDGGAEGIRTPDLLIANETLYQLSYDPIQLIFKHLQSNSPYDRQGGHGVTLPSSVWRMGGFAPDRE